MTDSLMQGEAVPHGQRPVYLFGAGLSRAVASEMPVLSQLGEEVINLLGLPTETLRPHQGDVEAWLSYLATPQPWLPEADNLRNRALFLTVSEAVFTIIDQAEQIALGRRIPTWLLRLAWHMSQQTASVITLNYDLLLERACMSLGRCTGFTDLYASPLTERSTPGTGIMISRNPPPLERILLHKLHGSTNWLTSGQAEGQQSGAYIVRNNGVWSPDASPPTPDRRYADLRPMVVPPVANKSDLYGNEALRATWSSAAGALHSCTNLMIIGYSFPVTDGGTRTMVTSLLQPTARVTVVDRSAEKAKQIARLLGENRTQIYSGNDGVAQFVQDNCPHLIEHGVTRDPASGALTPHLLVDDVACTDLPNIQQLEGPDNFNDEQRFSRWVGQQFPGATSARLMSARYPDMPGGLGFSDKSSVNPI